MQAATMSPVTTTALCSSGGSAVVSAGGTVVAVGNVPTSPLIQSPSLSPSPSPQPLVPPSVTIAVPTTALVSSANNSTNSSVKSKSCSPVNSKLPELASISARIAILTANQSKSFSSLSGPSSRRQLSPPPPPLTLLTPSLLLSTSPSSTPSINSGSSTTPPSPVPLCPAVQPLSLPSLRTSSASTRLSDHHQRGHVISIILSEEDEEAHHLHHPGHPHHPEFHDDYEDEGFNEENGSSHSNVSGTTDIIPVTERPKLTTIEVTNQLAHSPIDIKPLATDHPLASPNTRLLERTTSDTTANSAMFKPSQLSLSNSPTFTADGQQTSPTASPTAITPSQYRPSAPVTLPPPLSPPSSPFDLSFNQKCQIVPKVPETPSDSGSKSLCGIDINQPHHHPDSSSPSPVSTSPSSSSVTFTSHTMPSKSKSSSNIVDPQQQQQQQQQQLPLHLRRANALITGPNGSIRGKRNIVRKSVSNYTQLVKQANLEKGELERDFVKEERNKCVLYVTTLGIIRKTFEDSKQIRAILKNNFIEFDERDVYINEEFKNELRLRMGVNGEQLQIPILFERGQKLGGFTEIEKLNESGELVQRLNRYCNQHQSNLIDENLDGADRGKEEEDDDDYDDEDEDDCQAGNERPLIISTKLLNTKSKQLAHSSLSIGSATSGPWRECGRCGGTKFVNCVKCNGSRKTYIHHFDCASVTLKCSQCRKTGLVRCPDCS